MILTHRRLLAYFNDNGAIYTLTGGGRDKPYALEASIQHDGLTYSREFTLDGKPETANRQLAAARAWCKAMTADLAARLALQETAQ